jgi:hypothetical protein
MADERSFIERAQSRARGYTGREATADELARDFAGQDIRTRVEALEELAAEQGAITSPREAARHLTMTRALRDTHERLRKIDR